MYDHQTESLWLQVKRKAVAGPMTGTKLEKLASTITSWEKLDHKIWTKLDELFDANLASAAS